MDDHLSPEEPVEDQDSSPSNDFEEVEVFAPLDPATKDEVDRLLSLAHFANSKGATAVSQKHLDDAVALAPHSPDVLVAVGDSLLARNQLKRAHDAYARAHKIDKSHVDAERKFGETLLKLKAVELAFLGGSDYVSPASGKSALILSVFVPGLGQYVMGDEQKGVIYFLVWLAALLSGQFFGGGLGSAMSVFSAAGPGNPFIFVAIGIAILAHLASIMDAASYSKKLEVKPIDRPTPPVDKPFEL
ncbi:MAG: hypothetical protein KF812_12340 [Fimbriimonadaceae bacterium]|nr:hypothetical protein [Fimbriimonadaceae bacterium]